MRTSQSQFNARILIMLFSVCIFAIFAPKAHAQSLNEDSLKASYILRFIDFVRWDRPIRKISRIGVMNDASLFRALSATAIKKSNATRTFKIEEVTDTSVDIDGLDMIYFGPDQQQAWPEFVELSRQGSIITVSSQIGFLEAGGLIEFVTMQNRLRFSLNLLEVDSYNLGMSSKLVQLSVP